ncbi:hypothetical protein [Arthrobacter sp. 7Tela_A1]|uniref:hypothetical protein n=1 Tax=Arthrobacter sp. 7Tela_A1 TaxID=3093745 RepID=UPI003BB55142
MRWESLFADLEAQLAAAGQAGLEAEIAERQRGESASIGFTARLRGQHGGPLKVYVDGVEEPLWGELRQVGAGWFLLKSSSTSHLVPLQAVRLVEGMGRFAAAEEGLVQLKLSSALRGVARDRYPVRLQLRGAPAASLHGSIDRVGLDFLEFAVLEPGTARRRENVASAAVVPFRAVAVISSTR